VWETRLSSAPIIGDVKSEDRAKADRDVTSFYDYVGMSAKQREQAKKIMSDSRPEFKKIYDETRPQMEALQKQTRNQIRAILTEEQNKRYDEFNDLRHQRRGPQRPN
jgi:hypothetical protein